MVLEFKVINQRIVYAEKKYVVNDSIDYLYCHFCFSDDWSGQKTAVFKKADKSEVFQILIDENNLCKVPEVVLKATGFYISAFCGNLITADEIFVETVSSGYSDGGSPPPPEDDVYNQIIELLNEISSGSGGGIIVETDPTVPEWAKQASPPSADEVGAVDENDYITNTEILEIIGGI